MSTFFNIYKVTVDLNLLLDNFFLQRAGDTPLRLTKNEIMALKKLVFSTVQKTFKIARVKDADFDAWNVHLNSVLVWQLGSSTSIHATQKTKSLTKNLMDVH